MTEELSVQERYAPRSVCFGCGPANHAGLRIASFERGRRLEAEWQAHLAHEAFPGILNGGICGTLLDCHANWAAAMHLMREAGAHEPPATVTAEYEVKLYRPTPTADPIHLRSWVISSEGRRAIAAAEIVAGGVVTASFRGSFVAVRPGHPAYGRWYEEGP